jgi:hypothetical protein
MNEILKLFLILFLFIIIFIALYFLILAYNEILYLKKIQDVQNYLERIIMLRDSAFRFMIYIVLFTFTILIGFTYAFIVYEVIE